MFADDLERRPLMGWTCCFPRLVNLRGLREAEGEAVMNTRKAEDFSGLSVIGIDIGKDVFHLVGFDAEGNLVL